MKKWQLYAIGTISKYLGEVEAETKEEAEVMGWEHDEVGFSLCHHCSRSAGEVGDVEKIEVEESDD